MKKIFSVLFLLTAFLTCRATDLTQWQMQQEGSKTTFDVVVPCTVAGALNEAGFYGKHVLEELRYYDLDKGLFDTPWIFTTKFAAEKGLHHMLRFEGIGYAADIYVNGKQIAAADTTYGVFCIREYDITNLVKKKNELKVRVYKAPEQSLNVGYVDWNPRPVDESMGIVRKVELISTPDVQIKDVFVKPEVDPDDLKHASFTAEATLVNHSSKAVTGTLRGTYDNGSFEKEVKLAPGEAKVVKIREEVKKPRIWWSYDMGRPEMYKLNMAFVVDGKNSFRTSIRFGLRDIQSKVDENGHRLFILNGRPVLIKSAGWTDDIFMQDTPERTQAQLHYVRDMGLNSVRFENIWGKDQTVYHMCDSLGLMAMVGWSCQWEWEDYCGYPEFKGFGCINDPKTEALAIRYFHDQVLWLRNHPSVISWGTGSDRIPNDRLEKEYMKIYNRLDYRPYVCSAKGLTSKYGGPSGVKMEGPYEYVGPDYWYVDKKYGGAYGFNTETGVGMNIPQEESVRRMVGEDHLWPTDVNWNKHCTASASHMNSPKTAVKAMTGQYGAPKGFEDFVRKAHALDYDATRSMFEAFRCNVPDATGIVQWMLNSAWPSFYWQLFDWYLVPTAGYYGTKKACAPLQLVYNYADHCVYAVNETAKEKTLTAVMRTFGADSKQTGKETKEVTFRQRNPKKVFENIQGPCFLALEIKDEEGGVVADNFYCIPEENNVYRWEKTDWAGTPIKTYSDLSFVTALPETTVKLTTKPAKGGMDVTLTNNSDVIAYQNILKAKSADGNLIPAVIWSDNFVTLLPGESRTFRCTLPKDCSSAAISMSGWNATAKAQATPDSLDRNRSKYATYDFSQTDQYSKDDIYPIVSVSQPKGKKIKNVIFLIGDGMGFEQISCAWVVNGGALNMDAMPYMGASRTYAANALITDSCAGGAALASGQKTNYGYIGLDPDGEVMDTALKKAQRTGRKTGITVTCRLNDATPSDFCNHSASRSDEEYVMQQFVDSDVDFISGGGRHFFDQRTDGRNLIKEMQKKGYTFVDKLKDISRVRSGKFLGVYDEYDLPPVAERGEILLESTKKAIQMLDNSNGFFLMIEGSQIDDYGHKNNIGMVCEELFDFDRTLGYVLEWAAKDGQTLVVVTADHATGGLTLLKGDLAKRTVKVNFSTKGHNGILVPVFAFGPGAEAFAGVHENAEIGQLIMNAMK